MDAYAIHYKNKYPDGRVQESETGIDVYDAQGGHRVALRKDGSGQWHDRSARFGCIDAHDLAPIPRDARVHKLSADGKRGLDEKAADRKSKRSAFVKAGKVQSCEELSAQGWAFDEKGEVKAKPAAPAPASDSQA
jgi:hypothetical protein